MYRVCFVKGKLVQMQSGGDTHESPEVDDIAYAAKNLDTLRQNAINQGYAEKDIEVKWVDDKEWEAIEATLNQPTAEQVAEREREALIKTKMREMAEAELIAEGVLTADGKLMEEGAVK